MGADTGSPAKVTDSIIDASTTCMALRLQGVPSDCAQGCGCVAGSHEDGIGSMAIVVDTGIRPGLVSTNTVPWGSGQAKTRRSHSVWVGFESHDWKSVCKAQERTNNATERMSREPYVCARVSLCDVVVQVARCKVVVTLLAEALDKTGRVAGVGVCHAIADLFPLPRSTLAAATRPE